LVLGSGRETCSATGALLTRVFVGVWVWDKPSAY
jgi:hypothetical protein